jgi:EAL domain-containing protein (putative c-di-GMP-specific phosphodiesterase class I)/cellulose synthase/poly-beta-1,6-N-acetylglucosamine synthase-like glycosyltransferase
LSVIRSHRRSGPLAPASGRKHWGADRRSSHVPALAPPVSDRRVALGRLAIVVTVCAWLGYFGVWLFTDLLNSAHSTAVDRAESILYLVVVTLPTASALAYLLARLGFFYRTRNHYRSTRRELDNFFDTASRSLTVIVPSYQEEARIIRNTLLSAALQEYPNKRITLLIDDPPAPRFQRARQLLDGARALPEEIERLLSSPAANSSRALRAFEDDLQKGFALDEQAMFRLAESYEQAASWLEQLASGCELIDHTDVFFVNEVLLALVKEFTSVADAVRHAASEEVVIPVPRMRQLYRRLVWTFGVEVTSFERKRYASLSNEANKASNLNSYIGLMGGSYREMNIPSGLALVPSGPVDAQLTVPNPDYVLTLDADSVLLPEYCLRLVQQLEQTEHQDVAIAQTPYTSFPGAATRLERIAGATTDLQHIVHQGLTYYDATFWVGANAIIRKEALNEIAQKSHIGDWEVRQYISDHTVIEDTESTLEMGIHGWKLLNYPERLSFSATPPDFGSLCIQRLRWANGGLLILPKLRRLSRARRANGARARSNEKFLRLNYMASISWSTVSLLVLLAFPFNSTLISPVLGLVALPYFVTMASDLHYCGYKRTDVARIYGLNLILLPVNLAGTIASLTQGLTASKSAFIRTPKVRDRTVAPALFLIAPYVLISLAGYTAWVAYRNGLMENLGYAGLNILLTLYAIVAFIGVRHSLTDAWVHFKSLLYKKDHHRRPVVKKAAESPAPALAKDWQAVLQVGPVYARRWASETGVELVRQSGGRWQLTSNSGHAGGALRRGPAAEETRGEAAADAQVARAPEDAAHHHQATNFAIVFQPIVDLDSAAVVGFDALARLEDGTSPERWLASASSLGTGTDFEGALARAALSAAEMRPRGGVVAIRASLALITQDTRLLERLGALDRQVVVEVPIPGPAGRGDAELAARLLPPNVRLAFGQVELNSSSLEVISSLRPAFVKLRLDTVTGIADDSFRQTQVKAILSVLEEFGGSMIATGIETPEDQRAIRQLGVRFGQGFLFGRPQELAESEVE